MNERPASPPVAINKGMDGLKLGMRDGRLDHCRQRVIVAEGA